MKLSHTLRITFMEHGKEIVVSSFTFPSMSRKDARTAARKRFNMFIMHLTEAFEGGGVPINFQMHGVLFGDVLVRCPAHMGGEFVPATHGEAGTPAGEAPIHIFEYRSHG